VKVIKIEDKRLRELLKEKSKNAQALHNSIIRLMREQMDAGDDLWETIHSNYPEIKIGENKGKWVYNHEAGELINPMLPGEDER
jgi:hypothetical protein